MKGPIKIWNVNSELPVAGWLAVYALKTIHAAVAALTRVWIKNGVKTGAVLSLKRSVIVTNALNHVRKDYWHKSSPMGLHFLWNDMGWKNCWTVWSEMSKKALCITEKDSTEITTILKMWKSWLLLFLQEKNNCHNAAKRAIINDPLKRLTLMGYNIF